MKLQHKLPSEKKGVQLQKMQEIQSFGIQKLGALSPLLREVRVLLRYWGQSFCTQVNLYSLVVLL